MKPSARQIELFARVLKYAYRENRQFRVRPEWERDVMSHILGLNAMQRQADAIWDAPAIWRTAAAMSLCSIIIVIFSFVTNVGPEYEAARFLLEDPLGAIFAQPFFQ
jgi:hypothetical protein